METKYKVLKDKYDRLKHETLDMMTKIEYLKGRKAYNKRKIEFYKNVYKRLCETFDITQVDPDFESSDEELPNTAGKIMKKVHV